MGWFITQSLLFIIIAAVVFFLLGLWVGWILWARRSKAAGRHTAETVEKRTTSNAAAAAPAAATTAGESDRDTGTSATAEPAETPAPVATALAVPAAEAATESTADADAPAAVATLTETEADKTETVDTADTEARTAPAAEAGTETDTATAGAPAADGSDVATGGAGVGPTADAADIEDENLALYAGAEKDVVAEAEAAIRDAAAGTTAAAGEAVVADDDLTRIEGVGPKIAKALKEAGYGTYAKVAAASEDDIRAALAASGIKFAPAASSFASQAQYLAEGDEDGLAEYQDYLIAGRDRKSAEFVEEVDYTDVDDVEGEAAKQAAIEADAEKVAEATGDDVDAAAVVADTAVTTPADDDLQAIEGIGPKIEKALKADGITSYAQVAGMDEAALRASIGKAGIKFAPSVSNWAAQAEYLVNGDDEGLKEFQDYLIGGQERGKTKFVEEVDYTDVDEIEDEAAKQAALKADAEKVAEAEGGQA